MKGSRMMYRVLKVLLKSIVVVAVFAASATVDAQQSRQRYIFPPIIDALMGGTRVPIRLPGFLPFNDDASNPLYANILTVNEQGYTIEVGWDPDCSSNNACHFVTLYGSRKPLALAERKRTSVALTKGLQGQFGEAVCGTVCGNAEMAWTQDGIYYAVAMKSGKLNEMVQVANSEIEADPLVGAAH